MRDIFKRNPRQAQLPNEQPAETLAVPLTPAEPAADSNVEQETGNRIELNEPHQARWTFTRPGATKNNLPDNLWVKCPKCKELLYTKELENNKKVCHKCGHHFRLRAYERINMLVDEGSFVEIDHDLISADPLGFVSLVEPSYPIKMQQERDKTKLNDAVISGQATIEGLPLAMSVVDFAFQGGSMGSVFGEKLVRAVELAIAKRLPLLTISASGGARMHEGMFSLMQMAKTTAAMALLGSEKLLHIALLTDPLTGGVIASYTSVADFILAEPGALIGFAGPRVIEQITKQKLPPGFQTAEFLLEHGMVDRVVPRKELRTILATLLGMYSPTTATLEMLGKTESKMLNLPKGVVNAR